MSIYSALERVTAIRQTLADPATLISSNSALTGGTEAPSSFATVLQQASTGYEEPSESQTGEQAASSAALGSPYALSEPGTGSLGATYPLTGSSGVLGASSLPPATGTGNQIVAVAESQLGQAEQPPGSNESPAIAQYRAATAGATPGAPWCAYFASWAARQAGEPIGAQGEGLGSVSEIWSWAQSNGRAVVNGPGVVPKPGDLIVFGDEHVGIVRGVLASGQIATIEGNYENKVAANIRSPTEATGYVSMS